MKVIHISISGPVQTGKSAVYQSIKKMLEQRGYCVAVPDRAERLNPSDNLDNAASHEKPTKDETVVVLTEHINNT